MGRVLHAARLLADMGCQMRSRLPAGQHLSSNEFRSGDRSASDYPLALLTRNGRNMIKVRIEMKDGQFVAFGDRRDDQVDEANRSKHRLAARIPCTSSARCIT